MTDVFSEAKRSEVMSKIRGKGNKATEIALISVFRKNGITGWRRNYKIFGKPDFVFNKQKLAIFVDGCFWHQCPFHATLPRHNQEFWLKKLTANVERDREVTEHLQQRGWNVMRIWEHELRDGRKIEEHIRAKLKTNEK
jgi:DNA mismatch endonuclease (patch repair protein)